MTTRQSFSADSDAVRTHLNISQGVIQRTAENARSCKVWCITLVSAILVLAARTGEANHALIALMPTMLFWVLDAYYLGLERRFRESYNAFVEKIHRDRVCMADLYTVIPAGSATGHFLWALVRSFAVVPFYAAMCGMVVIAWLFIF